jgi:hypothetical protein
MAFSSHIFYSLMLHAMQTIPTTKTLATEARAEGSLKLTMGEEISRICPLTERATRRNLWEHINISVQ